MRWQRGLVVVSVAGLLVLAGCVGGFDIGGGSESPDGEIGVDGELEVHHIDVGQADSTLIVTPAGETILIDTGDWRPDGRTVIEYLEERDIDRIDHLVTTHSHADHIGGHAAVIEYVEEHGEGVGAVYDPGVSSTSQTYGDYLDAIDTYDVRLFQVEEGNTLPLEDDAVEASVLNPPEDGSSVDIDVNSVVLAVEFGEFTYLTTGDIERTAEQRLVEEYGDELAADVYQAGHHGSSTSSTDPFLDRVAPEVTVISSTLESQYGHPDDEVLEALADRGVETYWTGVHGDVVITTDGDDVSVTTETEATTDPEALLERKHDAQSTSQSPAVQSPVEPRESSVVEPGPVVDGASAPTVKP